MPIAELIERSSPGQMIRVNDVVKEWQVGETYEAKMEFMDGTPGHIKFLLTDMDPNGMMIQLIEFNFGDNNKEERAEPVRNVVPAPS